MMKSNQIVFAAIAALSWTLAGHNQSFASNRGNDFDHVKMSVQGICPVTGEKLIDAAAPVKVKIGLEQIFLSSKQAASGKINPQHWVTIHKNFAAAQGVCPVMEKKLPANPKFTNVNGHTVYICCPPCTKKIQAEPQKYLTKVAGYYQAALQRGLQAGSQLNSQKSLGLEGLSTQDQLLASVQKTCPVSGNVLGSSGAPTKARIGGVELFLCCKGCQAGKVNPRHWATIARNFKNAQSICPVMEKALPANARQAVVNGRMIFVCCPPCIKKIQAEPNKYLAKIDALYRSSRLKLTKTNSELLRR